MTIADKLTEIAENVPKVYEAGKKSQYDEFWDAFQQNGNRKYYPYAFSFGWNGTNFSPKHPLTNLLQVTYMFFNSEITNVNVVSGINGIRADAMFSQSKQLQTIKKLIVDENTTFASNSFYQCEALENIAIEGVIASDINIQYSPLSKASITSVINALSSSVSGKSVSLSKNAVIEAFRSGVNLLSKPYVDSTKEVNGIIFTENDDGTITANGTATADATFSVKVFQTTQNNSFALVGCPVGGSDSTYYIAYEGYGRDYGNGVMWDGTRSFWDTVTIVIKSGTKVSNLKFAPQINNINEWNTLIATKDNWTISLV